MFAKGALIQFIKSLFMMSVLLVVYPVWAGQLQADILLMKMTQAMQNKSYHGIFVYLADDKLENMEFVHRKTDYGVNERLYSLNGETFEIVRDGEILTCISPRTNSVMVDMTSGIRELPEDLATLADVYTFAIIGKERIANHQTTIVNVKPKDSYRYGYRFWIDDGSYLLVKSNVINEKGKVVEQLMFTQLTVSENISDHLFTPVTNSQKFRRHKRLPENTVGKVQSKWRINHLPNGFALKKHQTKSRSRLVEHMMFSDGMASLSVFIAKKAKTQKALHGHSKMGAVNAYGRFIEDYHITTIGEVPLQTTRLVNNAINLKK